MLIFVSKFKDMLQKTIEIVRRASGLMMQSDFAIEQKGGCENIVTSSDIAVQGFLCRNLAALLPGCGFICEEEDVHDPDKEYVWVIDPIDGTANYARGLEDCAISVALKKGCEVILGVVFLPYRDRMFWAEKGKGAFLNGKSIHTSERRFKDSILCAAMSTYRKEYADVCSDVIMDAFHQCNDVRRFGSAAVELCLLAAGYIELYFEIRLQPWDYAAAGLILQEAGGTITGLDGRWPRFDGPDLVCAGNDPENQARMLDIIRKHIRSIPYVD